MRKHRIALVLLMAGLGVIIVALHQPTAPTADRTGNAGGTAALVSAHLADDSLSPATTTAGSSSGTTPPTRSVALDSLRSTGTTTTAAAPSGATTVVDVPSAGQSITTTGTTAPSTATTTETTTVPTVTTVPNAPPIVAAIAPTTPAGGVWAELRWCESRDNYADNTGNGYYGAYQFSLQTWEGIGYQGLPSNAPPAVQDQAAQRLQARSGWGQWPACAAHLGLL
jgi:hypothetical protein